MPTSQPGALRRPIGVFFPKIVDLTDDVQFGGILGTNLAGRFADSRPLTTFITATAASLAIMTLLALLPTHTAASFALIFLLGAAGMGIPPAGTGLAVRAAPIAPALATAIAVSTFNGGTTIGTWIGTTALASPLNVRGPLVVGIAMATLGLLTLIAMAARPATGPTE
ncbi:hypothetical protein EV646_11350 [Kribbella antiqua]|uniref:MFS transporter n=1 Tax=Kribbella antiqua TaxID=2512217 RepID=A0A4R2IFI5_9ACTN|nr:hypothetical protein [Kribbella antiqua]TCO42428.1 hypothetical protein EV646_11350 [Kribbella antiqua]